MRKSASMKRLVKGDQFRSGGMVFVVTGRPLNHPSGDASKVHVPVTQVPDGKRSCRRTFKADKRVTLL
jgi:hypothetical protein